MPKAQPTSSCVATNASSPTLLYIAADIDIQLLKTLRPFETRAVLIDPLSDDWSAGQGHQVVSDYQRKHTSDSRPGYRETTQSLRPWKSTYMQRFANIISMRMAESGFQVISKSFALGCSSSNAYKWDQAIIDFTFEGRRRQLEYRVGNPHQPPGRFAPLGVLGRLDASVSTLTFMGGGMPPRLGRLVQRVVPCESGLRILGSAQDLMAMAKTIPALASVTGSSSTAAIAVPRSQYEPTDTLAGAALVSFDLEPRQLPLTSRCRAASAVRQRRRRSSSSASAAQ